MLQIATRVSTLETTTDEHTTLTPPAPELADVEGTQTYNLPLGTTGRRPGRVPAICALPTRTVS